MKSVGFAAMVVAWLITAVPAMAEMRAPRPYGHAADLVVYDVTGQRELPVYAHEGRQYVAGVPGHRYAVRIYTRGPARHLAVVSVDGLNVLTGSPAAPSQTGYVIAPGEMLAVDGWRKSLQEVAAFTFTSVPESYAGRTQQDQNVGVIGAALFREKMRRIYPMAPGESDAAAGAADPSRIERKSQELGTGHGPRQDSPATRVEFERASPRPDLMLAIYYDSEESLRKRGIIPQESTPNPFPGSFVPDP